MTEQLKADLELELGSALRSVEDLRREVQSQLAEAIDSFSDAYAQAVGALPAIEPTIDAAPVTEGIETAVAEADATVEPEADAGAIAAEIEGAIDSVDPTVTVEGDVSPVQDAIETLQTEDVEIAIVADASQAESEIQDLTNAVEDVGVELGGFASSTDVIAGGTRVATGELAGMTAGLETLGDKVGLPLTGVLALAGATTAFTTEAIDALGATQRFESTLGNMADRVENLQDIEGLNTNLSELALTLGSDDDKIRNVVARLFELARASGINNDEASIFVERMTALGARAVALNPQLGDVGDVTDALSTALVRGGRFAAKFGLDLNQAEINTRALRDANKESTDQLTFVEKAMAGAAIATEKYGGNLEDVIARGSENAITTQRRLGQAIRETVEELGQPLIAPVFELLAEGQPVAEQTGRILVTLGQIILPLVVAAIRGLLPFAEALATILEAIAPPLTAVADALAALPAPLLAAAIGFAALPRVMDLASVAIQGLMVKMGTSLGTIAAFEGASLTATSGVIGFQSALLGFAGAAAAVAAPAVIGLYALGAFGEVSSGVNAELAESSTTVRELRDQLRDFADRQQYVNELQDQAAAYAKKNSVSIDSARASISGLSAAEQILAMKQDKLVEQLTELAKKNPEAARTFIDQARAVGISVHELERLEAALERGSKQYDRRVRQAAEQQVASEQFQADVAAERDAMDSASDAADAQAEALKRAEDAVNQFADSAIAKFPTIDQAFEETQRVAETFALKFLPINVLEEQVQKATDAIGAFPFLVQALFDRGLDNVAQLVIDKGPVAGGLLAKQILDAEGPVGDNLDRVLGQYDTFTTNTENFLRGTAGPRLTGTFAEFHDRYPEISYDTFQVLQGMYASEIGVLGGQAGAIGTNATTQFGSGLDGMPPATQAALGGVAGVLDQGSSILGSDARVAGLVIGSQLGGGIYDGLQNWDRFIADLAARIIRNAESAAREEAQSDSPSKLFAALGEDITEGLGVGMEAGVPEVVHDAEDVVRQAWLGMQSAPRPPESIFAAAGGGNTTTVDRSFHVHGGINNTFMGGDRQDATVDRLRDYAHLAGGW